MALKIQKIDQTGVIYADPSDPGLTVRFKQGSQGKSLNGVSVANHVTEVIYTDDVPVTISGVSAVDAVSIRLRVSGTAQAKARIKSLLVAMAADVDNWSDEDVFGGFRPVTTPTQPV
ncbi:MAG: hypothetical protein [Sanya duin-like virus 1]|nr:MAG: hypothetical protein [Sanya duin-like virus 1]